MNVSVIICAYTMDRWESLVVAVRSSLNQTLAPQEVVVVIDHNDELFHRATLELPDALVVPNISTKGLSGARNTGVSASSGDIIAFLDDDAYAQPDWLSHLMVPLVDPKVVGVGGWIIPSWVNTAAGWFPETFYWVLGCSYAGLPPANSQLRNPIGTNMAMRRHVFAMVGGFTSGIGRVGLVPLGCEETELCIRYTERFPQERFVQSRDAIVHHRVPASRLTWHYFWTRCWAEGLSKAAVSSLVGFDQGLAAERRHVMRTLPRELGKSLRSVPRHPRDATVRVALILIGTALAVAGLLRGQIALRHSPIAAGGSELEFTVPSVGDDGGSWSLATWKVE